jgi:2-beta-glucuronyltransferase
MKLFKWTGQPFLAETRKVSTHFIAEQWARSGHDVHVATVGLSELTRLKDRRLYAALEKDQKNRFHVIEPGLSATAYMPLLHPFSSGNKVLNRLMRPAFELYGDHIPVYLRTELKAADAVFFEPGTCLSFFDAARSLNPGAAFVYIKRDWLTTIGAGPYLQELEQEILSRFDLIVSPSSVIAAKVGKQGNAAVLPQGIDKELIDRDVPSPYEQGSKNAVSVGNMLFDEHAVRSIAEAAPDVTIHVFGARFQQPLLKNVIDHGEQPFARIVPYLRHADFGIAPYRMRPEDVYLAETSLKLLQYAYCRLPVLLPDLIPDHRGNLVGYDVRQEADWRGKVDQALAMPKADNFRDGILSWDEVAGQLATLARNARP